MKKLIACVLIVVLSMAVVFGGGQAESKQEETVTLKVLNWGNVAEEKLAQESIDAFMQDHPNVVVEQTCVPVVEWTDYITKWSTMITSGNAPDLVCIAFECSQMAQENNLVKPLNAVIDQDQDLANMVSEYTPAILSGISDGDTIYGLPTGTQTMVMYYNKNMFDAAGISYPTDDWTWDEFLDISRKLTSKDVYGFGLSSSYFQLVPWWVSNNTNLIASDNFTPTINNPKMVEAVTYLNKFVEEGLTPDPISSDVYTMFSQGKLAMVGAGRWPLPAWMEAGMTNSDFDCVQWPQNRGTGTVYGGSAWCVSSTTKHENLTIELLKYMVSSESIEKLAAGGQQIPSFKSLALDPEIMGTTPDNVDGLWEAVSTATVCPAPIYYGDLNRTVLTTLEKIFTGQGEVKQQLDAAQASIEKLIADL
jgi:multiple sugar transport system substrate-binding protein